KCLTHTFGKLILPIRPIFPGTTSLIRLTARWIPLGDGPLKDDDRIGCLSLSGTFGVLRILPLIRMIKPPAGLTARKSPRAAKRDRRYRLTVCSRVVSGVCSLFVVCVNE